jgi:hypothetical protein
MWRYQEISHIKMSVTSRAWMNIKMHKHRSDTGMSYRQTCFFPRFSYSSVAHQFVNIDMTTRLQPHTKTLMFVQHHLITAVQLTDDDGGRGDVCEISVFITWIRQRGHNTQKLGYGLFFSCIYWRV